MTRKIDVLSPKQHLALLALLSGDKQVEAAQKANVHENQVCTWMKNPLFLETLHSAEAERLQELNRSLIGIARKATNVLEEILDDSQEKTADRTRAANIVLTKLLNLRELVIFENRLAKLEELLHETQTA
jgi:hypothetical protein